MKKTGFKTNMDDIYIFYTYYQHMKEFKIQA